jgi:hypothetical protein
MGVPAPDAAGAQDSGNAEKQTGDGECHDFSGVTGR